MAKKPNKTNTIKKRIAESKAAMILALEKSMGIVTNACSAVGINRTTHYEWYNTDEDYKNKVDSITDIAIDFAETKLHQKINGVKVAGTGTSILNPIVYDLPPSDTAIIFFLKCKGKKRGYIERSEVTGADGTPLNPPVPLQNLTFEQLQALANEQTNKPTDSRTNKKGSKD